MKKQYLVEKSACIDAQPQDIFSVLIDVGQWRTWTPSITNISLLDNHRPGPGARIKVWQPKLVPAIWTITEVAPRELTTASGLHIIDEFEDEGGNYYFDSVKASLI